MASGFDVPIDRRTFFRLGGAGLAAAGLAAALGACGDSDNPNGLKMLYFGPQTEATALQNALQPEIAKLDKNATFKVTGVNGTDWNDFLAKMLTQIASGSTPDIVSVATEGLQLMASKELLVPLDSYVTKDLAPLQNYFDDTHPALLESAMYQGHLYELPDSFNTGSMFYNTSLLKRAGLDAPKPDWTVDDFHRYAVAIGRLGSDVIPFDWVVRLWGSWTSFLYANGGNLLEESKYPGGDWLWKKAYASQPAAVAGRGGGWNWAQPTANSAEAIEALQYVIDLQRAGLSPSPDVGGGQTLQGLFSAGRIGLTVGGGFWAGGLHNGGMADGAFDVQMFPTWKTNKSLFGAGGYGIFTTSKKKDLAWEVVKMMVRPQSFDDIYPGNTTTPGRRSLMTADRYKTTGPANWSVFYDQLNGSVPISAPPYYNALATSLNQRTTQAISSGNAKAALDGMQSDLEKARS